MTSKPEREVDARLADWVDGRLSERERERFVAELRVSPQLRKDLEDYEKTVAAVRAALQAPARPVQVADRVMAAIAAGNTRTNVGPRWRNRSFLWSLASAAALLVLALLVNTWSPAPKTDTTASLDAAKAEGEKRRAGDDERKHAGGAGAVPAGERADREKLEKVAVEEQASVPGTNPAAPAAPATQPAPTPPAATAAAREPAPAEGNESGAERAAQAKPAAPPKAQPANDPAAPSGDAGGKQAGGGGAQPGAGVPVEQDLVTLGWGEQLPVIVVQGGALVADSRNTESRLQDGQSVPAGSSAREAVRQVPPAQPRGDAPATGAPSPGTAMSKAEEAAQLTPQLEAFFKRQMTVPSPSDTGGAAWSAGGLQFTPLHDAAAFAVGNERKETEAKAAGEYAKDRSRAGVGGKGSVALVERGWLVEGRKEDLEVVIRQLSRFARESGMQLTTGETNEAALPPRSAPEGFLRQSTDRDKPSDKADAKRPELARSRVVLRFSAQPR